jgi:hypothetical protein
LADPRPPSIAPPRSIGGRAIVVALLVALIAGSGALLDRTIGPKARATATAEGSGSGAWFCPHGGSAGLEGWVVLANPGATGVRVRLTTFDAAGARTQPLFTVPPATEVYRSVPAEDPAATTEVEYFGGWVGASALVASDSSNEIAAERCVASAHRTWFLPDASAAAGETATLVVMNPFGEVAEFDVSLLTEQRTVRPGSLSPYVVPPNTSVGLRLTDFLLQGQGETTLAVEVTVRIGRVIPGALISSSRTLRAEAGTPSVASRWIIPVGVSSGSSDLVVVNPGDSSADLSVIGQGASSQRVASGPNGLSVPGRAVRTFPISGFANAGMLIESTNRRPVVVALRTSGLGADQATVTGTRAALPRWLVLPTAPPTGGRTLLLLENPGRTGVRVSVALLGPNGSIAARGLGSISIPAGRTVQLVLPSAGTTSPAAIVLATGGGVVAGSASLSGGGSGFAATLGLTLGARS